MKSGPEQQEPASGISESSEPLLAGGNQSSSTGDPWTCLEFDRSNITEGPPLSASGAQAERPACQLFRGQENWLTRVWSQDGGEIATEIRTDIRQEVRALCAQWLKMQNVCALLGAGASKYIAGFVGADLYDRIKGLLANRPSGSTLEAISRLARDPANIGRQFEELLSQLALLTRQLGEEAGPLRNTILPSDALGLGKMGEAAKKLQELILDIERAIAVVCNVRLPESELTLAGTSLTPHEAFLAKVVSRDPQHGRGQLFTTNYDTLLEQAMDRLGIIYADGFTGTVQRRFNPASYYYSGSLSIS